MDISQLRRSQGVEDLRRVDPMQQILSMMYGETQNIESAIAEGLGADQLPAYDPTNYPPADPANAALARALGWDTIQEPLLQWHEPFVPQAQGRTEI